MTKTNGILILIVLGLLTYSLFFSHPGKKPDVKKYELQIDSLKQINASLYSQNDSLLLLEKNYISQIQKTDYEIARLNKQLDNIKKKYNEIFDSINNYNSAEFERFFSNRYK